MTEKEMVALLDEAHQTLFAVRLGTMLLRARQTQERKMSRARNNILIVRCAIADEYRDRTDEVI